MLKNKIIKLKNGWTIFSKTFSHQSQNPSTNVLPSKHIARQESSQKKHYTHLIILNLLTNNSCLAFKKIKE